VAVPQAHVPEALRARVSEQTCEELLEALAQDFERSYAQLFATMLWCAPAPRPLARPRRRAARRAGAGCDCWGVCGACRLEEMGMERDIQTFDVPRTTLKRSGAFLELRVPGLAEGRPSVLRGDAVHVHTHGARGPETQVGYTHSVGLESVQLRFDNRSCRSSHAPLRVFVCGVVQRMRLSGSTRATWRGSQSRCPSLSTARRSG
jgi:hypothetical protein